MRSRAKSKQTTKQNLIENISLIQKGEIKFKCDLCEKAIEDKSEMKKHMRHHSYISASYKCLDWDFICETDLGMEVHIGKEHADGFDCGLCGFKEQSLENLETHISTCEVYDCGHCDDRLKTLDCTKEHMRKNHEEF